MPKTAIILSLALALATAAFADDPGREHLVDLLASDATERIDFTATSFDEALGRIELVTDRMLDQTASLGLSGQEQVTLCAAIIGALDDFKPRTSGYTFGKLTLVILDDSQGTVLADLVATSATIVHEAGRTATARGAAESLFRGVVIDIEEGIPPLEQLLEHVRAVSQMPRDKQARFLS